MNQPKTKGGRKPDSQQGKAAGADYPVWWYAKTKNNQDGELILDKGRIEIDIIEFLDWLYECGYRYTKIYDNGILFRITGSRILEEIQTAQVRQFVVQWIHALPEIIVCHSRSGDIEQEIPRKLLMEKIIKGVSYFFDTKRLEAYLGPKEDFKMHEDTRDMKYCYFKNGFLQINRKGMEFCSYNELEGYIWSSEIIPHELNFEQGKDPKDQGQVKRFFQLVAAGKADPQESQETQMNRAERFGRLCEIAGYLMHSYTRYKLKAILLTDARMSDTGEPNGRSGKTLFMRLVGGFLCPDPTAPGQKTFVELSGKNFDPTDKHRYDKLAHETKLICLNDIKRNFKTEWLFNDITDGLEVNKKNQQPFMLMVKMAVLSNTPVDLTGDSNLDRFIVFEFADYFNKNHSPEMEFGCWMLGQEWNGQEWDRYYMFLAECVRSFLATGGKLTQPEMINYKRRNLINTVGTDLLSFIEEDWKPVPGAWYDLRTMFNDFVSAFPDNAKMWQKRFTERVQKYMNESEQWKPYNSNDNYNRISKDINGKQETIRQIRFLSREEKENKNPLDEF